MTDNTYGIHVYPDRNSHCGLDAEEAAVLFSSFIVAKPDSTIHFTKFHRDTMTTEFLLIYEEGHIRKDT